MTREPGYHYGDGSGTEPPSPAEYMDEPVLRLEHLEVERELELEAQDARREKEPWRYCQVSREVVIDGDSGLCPLCERPADLHLAAA